MKIFTISDLHLPLGIDKPMDVFGEKWNNYVERIRENWQAKIGKDDVVVLGGDFSWATYLEQAKKDFDYLEGLNGKKILLKGNHDYWWTTAQKLKNYVSDNGYSSIIFLHNNHYKIGNIGICGTRGWVCDNLTGSDDRKIYDREVLRLKMSLDSAVNNGCKRLIAFTHYPPFKMNGFDTEFTKTVEEYGAEKCIYGHLHGHIQSKSFNGTHNGVEYMLVSADYIGFSPVLIETVYGSDESE